MRWPRRHLSTSGFSFSLGLYSRHLFSALIALPPSGVVLVTFLDNSSSNNPLKVNFTKLKKTNQRKILNDFFLRRRRMDIFTKVSSLGRKLIYFFDFLLTTLFFRFKKFLTALVRIFRRRMIYREPYPTKADPIWCIRRRLPTPPHHRIHGAAEKNSTKRFSSSFFCSSSSSNR